MGVSKNRGTPKWMVYNGKLFLIKMDDLRVLYHHLRKPPLCYQAFTCFFRTCNSEPREEGLETPHLKRHVLRTALMAWHLKENDKKCRSHMSFPETKHYPSENFHSAAGWFIQNNSWEDGAVYHLFFFSWDVRIHKAVYCCLYMPHVKVT